MLPLQTVKSHKRDCAQLANKVAEVTMSISKEVLAQEVLVDDSLQSALESLER